MNTNNIDTRLPLCELHRHLDGAIRLQTILDLSEQHGIKLPARSLDGLKPYVQVVNAEAGLIEFLAKFKYLTKVLVDADACHRIARENVEDALAEGIDYIELRFSPWFMAKRHDLDPSAVVEAVIDGTRAGVAATGVKAQLIGILSRTYGPQICMAELDALLSHRDGLIALDLAGDEKRFPAHLFKAHFDRARDSNLHITVHAGEADGPESIRSAIDNLGAERIGHGIRAVEDEALMDYLARKDVGLEVCLTSNVHTSTVSDLASHPAKRLIENGVKVCLNTDDPGISGIDLPFEYGVAAPLAGLSAEMINQTQRNGLEMAFISASDKQTLIDRRLRQKSLLVGAKNGKKARF